MIASVSRPAVFRELASAPLHRTPLLWVSHVDVTTNTDDDCLGVAFSISRAFGNAVDRNRARRRIRAAFRIALDNGAPGTGAVLVRCRRSVLSAPFEDLVRSATTCLTKAHAAASNKRPTNQRASKQRVRVNS